MARAAIAAGADAIMVEVHVEPEKALSDGVQSLTPPMFEKLMGELRRVASAVDREI
jgi:3-deoxy-7-phosphoheptulonate synthase